MKKELIDLIDRKAIYLNSKGLDASYVASRISILNNFIDEKCNLSIQKIDDILVELIGFFTTSLCIPLGASTKFLRARAYKINYQETDVTQLSYISKKSDSKIKIGRLNNDNYSLYYGCLYFEDKGGVSVAFSESNSEINNTVNVLRSTAIDDVFVYFVGIYDYVHRHCKPRFMPQDMFDLFNEVYKYQQQKFSDSVFLAHVLCDAFLSDILRRKESGNLYKVTSRVFDIYGADPEMDGLIYTSVKSEGDPVVALKPMSVDSKLQHVSCDSYKILDDYGYAKYYASHTHRGTISNNIITWENT